MKLWPTVMAALLYVGGIAGMYQYDVYADDKSIDSKRRRIGSNL